MKNKVINLGNKSQTKVSNQGVKYSQLLVAFLEPFVDDFKEVEFHEDIFEFVINAWNSANMKLILPRSENNDELNVLEKEGIDVALLNKMIDYKLTHFKNYTNFIIDYALLETDEEPTLQVVTQEQDDYLESLLEKFDQEDSEADYEENYINRSAIVFKPKQSFIDWYINLYPGDIDSAAETKIYLISEDIEDIDSWLKKKFDKLFTFELASWHTNKKEWPQNRNYKMFKEWFQVENSTLIYDFEKNPIQKY